MNAASTNPKQPTLTPEQAADRLNISTPTLLRWVKAKRIRAHRLSSRLIRFSEFDIAEFLSATQTV